MSVTASDLKLYAATSIADDDTTAQGGAINTSDEVTGSTANEVFPAAVYAAAGGSDITHYYKMFFKNTSATNLTAAKIWIDNLLLAFGVSGFLKASSSSATDSSTYKLRIHGLDSGGTEREEYLSLNGLTEVTSSYQYSEIHNVCKVNGSYVPVVAVGDITIKISTTTIGKIPAGYYTANGEVKLALEITLDDTNTSTNRLTSPNDGGATPIDFTFYEAQDYASGLAVANSGILTAGSAQGLWVKRVACAGTYTSDRVDYVIKIQGSTT